jgi:hypothetical protein
MAGFSAGNKVYKTGNGGISWQNISYNLPNLPVNCIKQIPGTNNLIVATDIGVYVLMGGTTTWVNNSAGLPNVIVSDIEFNPALNKAYVSTFGRGIWETSLSILSSVNENEAGAVIDFKLFPTVNNGSFNLEIDQADNALLEIIDVMGRVVHSEKMNYNSKQFNLKLASGAYYARINSGKRLGVKKFVVE